jgi:stage V sporulation protein D (sporulation-specific penicillin-binding protein)
MNYDTTVHTPKKTEKEKTIYRSGRQYIYRRSIIIFISFLCIAVGLIIALANIQLINYEHYQSLTIEQYTQETVITAKRGTVYSSDGKVLAISINAERVFLSPNTIPQMSVRQYIESIVEVISNDEKQNKERIRLQSFYTNLDLTVSQDIAMSLSEILNVDYQMVLDKTARVKRKDETILREVELELTAKVREMVLNKRYSEFIHFSDDTKRYYPYSNLACHIIGFVGTDHEGLAGVEAYYNDLLKGTNGSVVTAKNGKGGDMSFEYEKYIDAKDGSNLMLTIDYTVQGILEKYLEQALVETKAEDRVCGIIMDVTNGEILAMSTKQDFNDPFELDDASKLKLDQFTGAEKEKKEYRSKLLYGLWKNKLITELYEPGSTFKMVTAAMALEEKLVTETERFHCGGSITIQGYGAPIKCHKTTGHGSQTFEEAIWHSCNPVFVTIGKRIGNDTFYEYYKAFGYTERTDVDLPGEAANYFFDLKTSWRSVELAVASFGQTFKVTALSHITAAAAIANGGYLVTPHVLKATLDDEGNVIESKETNVVRQVISEETSQTIMKYLENGVNNGGSGRNAYVQGYRVGAKTGTSVKTDIRTETGETKYVGSCVAFAPADDPKIAIIVLIDEPIGIYYGGSVAAPVVANVLAEVMPYLGIEPIYSEKELETMGKKVGNYLGLTVGSAKTAVVNSGFSYEVIGNGTNIVSQVPAEGSNLLKGGVVVLYTGGETADDMVSVPNLIGKTASAANKALINHGLNLNLINGTLNVLDSAVDDKSAIVVSQNYEPDSKVPKGTIVSVEIRYISGVGD